MEINDISKVLEHIKALYAEKEALAIKLVEQKRPAERIRHSEHINELATALAKAQAEMKIAGKDKENPYFKSKYADWESVACASRPALTKYGISVSFDFTTDENGAVYLVCLVTHNSGQWKESRIRYLPPKSDIQAMASYNTSLKRLMYSNAIGVVVGNEDDDGEIAMEDVRNRTARGTSVNNSYNPRQQAPEIITKEQLDALEYELAEFSDAEQEEMVQKIYEAYDIRSLADLPKSKFQVSIERLRKIKLTRKGVSV